MPQKPIRLPPLKVLRVKQPNKPEGNPCLTVMSAVLCMLYFFLISVGDVLMNMSTHSLLGIVRLQLQRMRRRRGHLALVHGRPQAPSQGRKHDQLPSVEIVQAPDFSEEEELDATSVRWRARDMKSISISKRELCAVPRLAEQLTRGRRRWNSQHFCRERGVGTGQIFALLRLENRDQDAERGGDKGPERLPGSYDRVLTRQ